jgi:UDP-glucose 4-epimerase
MEIAITGASGFIGRHLVQRLIERAGSGVTTTTIRALHSGERPSATWAFPKHLVRTAPLYEADGRIDTDALNGVDTLLHLGWSTVPATAEQDPQADQRTNVEGGLRLLDAVRAAGVRRVIFLSSGGTVHGPTDRLPIPEDAPTRPISAYGISKLLFESYLGLAAKRHGFEHVILRPGNVYGDPLPRQRPQGVIEHWMASIAAGRPIELWNPLSVTRDLLHVDDMVTAIVAAMEHPAGQAVLNIGTGVGTSLGELLQLLERVVGRPIPTEVRSTAPAAIPANVLDPRKAMEVLGFRTTIPLATGVERLWQQIGASSNRP